MSQINTGQLCAMRSSQRCVRRIQLSSSSRWLTTVASSVKYVLGIETSCDDTGVAIVTSDGSILAETVVGQSDVHKKHGGIVPDLAAKVI